MRVTVIDYYISNGNPLFNFMEAILASLEQGVAPAVLVIIYLLIIKVVDNRKESKQAKISKQLADSVSEISSFIRNMLQDIIQKDKDKCKITIEDSMLASGLKLINFISDTILHNHINENKENILVNIHNVVNSEYYTIYANLSLYTFNGVKVSDVMKTEWMAEIEKDITDIIYSEKLNDADKINTFMRKINLRIQSYITYTINKAIK